MTELPSLSIVIPHLNNPEGLRRCLAALAAQKAAPFEVIVVDNGSASLPMAVCAAFPFVTLTREAVPGPGPARNTGVGLARADLLAFLDCDCVAQPGWVAAILDWFAANPACGVISGDVRIARAVPGRATAIEAYESIFGYRFQMYIERDRYAGTANMAVRREVFDRVGSFAGIGIAEDRDWGRRAAGLGIAMAFVPQMRINTPARASFAELTRKWDRHIAHDFAEVRGAGGVLRWIVKAGALAISPVAELPRVLRSDRVSGARERLLALLCLTRIRAYRAWRMLSLLTGGDGGQLASNWRKPGR